MLLVGSVVVRLVVSATSADAAPRCPGTIPVKSGTPFCDATHYAESFPEIAGCPDADSRRQAQCPKEWVEEQWAAFKQGDVDPHVRSIESFKAVLACRAGTCSASQKELADKRPDMAWVSDALVASQLCGSAQSLVGELGPRVTKWGAFKRFSPTTIGEMSAILSAGRADVGRYCKKPG